jgi:CheY-like chemotaxis protein
VEFERISHSRASEPLKGLSILLVDDSPDYTNMMSLRLRKFGALIDVVHSGFAALELITQKRFDVVLMDIQMPGMDGLKTIKEIRTLGVRCPIITVTALKDIVELSPKQTAEIAAHAGKPTDIPDLIATIQGVIAICDL